MESRRSFFFRFFIWICWFITWEIPWHQPKLGIWLKLKVDAQPRFGARDVKTPQEAIADFQRFFFGGSE